jgi:hypothetical protein
MTLESGRLSHHIIATGNLDDEENRWDKNIMSTSRYYISIDCLQHLAKPIVLTRYLLALLDAWKCCMNRSS